MQWRKNETNYLATYGAFGGKKLDESKLLRILYQTTSESALDVQNLFVCNLVVKLFVYPSMKRKPKLLHHYTVNVLNKFNHLNE